jgi:hypothetical protein
MRRMVLRFLAPLACTLVLLGDVPAPLAKSPAVSKACTFKDRKLWGKVKVVTSFPDVKVQVVDAFPDLKVKWVDAFPDGCGKWKTVDSFPDLKVQFVTSFPDFTVRFVDAFPGLP